MSKEIDHLIAEQVTAADQMYVQVVKDIREGRQRGVKGLPKKHTLLKMVETQAKLSGDRARLAEQRREVEELFPD